MTTLIADLEMRQRKIGQAIQLLREAGLSDYKLGTSIGSMAAGAEQVVAVNGRDPNTGKRVMSAESRQRISDGMKERWAARHKDEDKLPEPQPLFVIASGSN